MPAPTRAADRRRQPDRGVADAVADRLRLQRRGRLRDPQRGRLLARRDQRQAGHRPAGSRPWAVGSSGCCKAHPTSAKAQVLHLTDSGTARRRGAAASTAGRSSPPDRHVARRLLWPPMKYGAGFSLVAMDDPIAIRDFAQALDDSGFDLVTVSRAPVGGATGPVPRSAAADLYRSVPRSVRAVRVPGRHDHARCTSGPAC